MASSSDMRIGLRQQLLGDALMGLREVPLVFAPRPAAVPAPRPAAPKPPAPPVAAPAVKRVAPPPATAARSGSSPPSPPPGPPVALGTPGVKATTTPAVLRDKGDRLRQIDDSQVRNCRLCRLCEERTRTVFGQGNPDARVVFVGEGPGYDEDQQGLAFVGKAGQLLTRMIVAMGLSREAVYICNTVKCRPPGNRPPEADEILACNPYLVEQLAIIEPEIIVALGASAAKTILGTAQSISALRGRWHEYQPAAGASRNEPIAVMPTFHPSYLLRSPTEKGKSWQDLQMVMQRLGLSVPQAGG
jgi:DNA polymerase